MKRLRRQRRSEGSATELAFVGQFFPYTVSFEIGGFYDIVVFTTMLWQYRIEFD